MERVRPDVSLIAVRWRAYPWLDGIGNEVAVAKIVSRATVHFTQEYLS